jgi:hypothetical protein
MANIIVHFAGAISGVLGGSYAVEAVVEKYANLFIVNKVRNATVTLFTAGLTGALCGSLTSGAVHLLLNVAISQPVTTMAAMRCGVVPGIITAMIAASFAEPTLKFYSRPIFLGE